jgi:hypothetical protein
VNPEQREEPAGVECGLNGYLDALDLLSLRREPAPGAEEARQCFPELGELPGREAEGCPVGVVGGLPSGGEDDHRRLR